MVGVSITVVICCYNKAAYIKDSIDSVLQQTSTNWRLIIVDDCSSDNSKGIIETFENLSAIQTVYNSENKGANFCRNLGLSMATTDYLMFLDGDDVLEKTCIERRLLAAEENASANLLVFTMGIFRETIGDSKYLWLPDVKDPLKNLLSHNLSWSIMQPLWRTDFLKSLNGFDLSFKRLQDVELNTRALLQSDLNLKMFNSAPDCFYRIDPNRLNYDIAEFLARWVGSSLQYVAKFDALVPSKYRKYLRLTLFQTYLQVLYYKGAKNLTPQAFAALQLRLTKSEVAIKSLGKKAWLFSLASFFNGRIKLPGVNYLIRQCLQKE